MIDEARMSALIRTARENAHRFEIELAADDRRRTRQHIAAAVISATGIAAIVAVVAIGSWAAAVRYCAADPVACQIEGSDR